MDETPTVSSTLHSTISQPKDTSADEPQDTKRPRMEASTLPCDEKMDDQSTIEERKQDDGCESSNSEKTADAQGQSAVSQSYEEVNANQFIGYLHTMINYSSTTSTGHYSASNATPIRVYENLKEDELHLVRRIATGRMGQVDLCVWKKNGGKLVAKKSLLQGDFTKYKENLTSEIAIVLGTQHPNIVTALGYIYSEHGLGLIMEYYKFGSYQRYFIDQNVGNQRTEEDFSKLLPLKLRILQEVISALQYLHSKSILHRDLKGQNILLDDDLHAKVCDFGLSDMKTVSKLSKQSSAANIGRMVKGTLIFMGPEHLSDPRYKATVKTDVYAFGIVAWQVMTDREPYEDDCDGNIDLVLHHVQVTNLRPDMSVIPSSAPDIVKDIIQRSWDKNPANRLTFQELHETMTAVIISDNDWKKKADEAAEFAKQSLGTPPEETDAISAIVPPVEWKSVRKSLQKRGGTSHLNYGDFRITCETDYYFDKFQLKWKCLCIDERTGHRAKAKGYDSGFGAGEHAVSKLIREMIEKGIYPRPIDEHLLKKD